MVAGLCFSLLGVFLAILFWLGVFPLRSQLLMGAPFYVTSCFSLAAFKILYLTSNFVILIMICLEVGLFGFLLIGTLCVSWTCVTFSLITLVKFSIITFSNKLSIPCSSSSPSGIPIIWIYYISCFLAAPLSYLHSFWVFLCTLSSTSLIRISASSSLLLIPSTEFFSSEIVFFISSWPLLIVSVSFFMLM